MRYILMMHAPAGNGEYQVSEWSPEDFRAHIGFMGRLNQELVESGEWVDGQGLAPPGQARVVRAGADGVPVTDGVFPESKEFLAGYMIVETEQAERAWEIAAKMSAAPGPGGVPLNMAIEVRQVLSAPPTDG
jgi:hypothetical protein